MAILCTGKKSGMRGVRQKGKRRLGSVMSSWKGVRREEGCYMKVMRELVWGGREQGLVWGNVRMEEKRQGEWQY